MITAPTLCSLNFRNLEDLIDPDRDLSAIPRSLAPADWIQPLDYALKPGQFLP